MKTGIIMKMHFMMIMLIMLFACEVNESPKTQDADPIENVTLKEKAMFGIGAAITTSGLGDSVYEKTVRDNFNQITAEYEMKMAQVWTSTSSFNWSKVDALVNFAEQNNMKVHGHSLLWYRSIPDWLEQANYDSLTFESKVKNYITTMVGRYKGTVVSWDVANEIFNDNGSLRIDETIYSIFSDPIAFYGRCFQYARDADPDVKLFYNDYNVVLYSGKRYAIKQMVERFKKEGYPIDGIGDQFHYMVTTNKNTIEDGLKDMATTGLLIHISELDIRVNVNKSDIYQFTLSEQQKQYDTYKAIVGFFEDLPQEQKFAITTWGVSDNSTWLTDYWHQKEYPLLFDKNFVKKKAYEGFLSSLK